MSDTRELMSGKIVSAQKVKTSQSGYETWTATFEDGLVDTVVVKPELDVDLSKGGEFTFFKGPYGGWLIDDANTPTNSIPNKRTRDGRVAVDRKGNLTREGYWDLKEKYEREQRDPRIEFQAYFTHVLTVYAAAIDTLAKPPQDIEGVNAYIDDAYYMAQKIFERRQKEL